MPILLLFSCWPRRESGSEINLRTLESAKHLQCSKPCPGGGRTGASTLPVSTARRRVEVMITPHPLKSLKWYAWYSYQIPTLWLGILSGGSHTYPCTPWICKTRRTRIPVDGGLANILRSPTQLRRLSVNLLVMIGFGGVTELRDPRRFDRRLPSPDSI